jgi:predicted transcriptional regulator
MLDEHQRIAVLELAHKGLGTRRIARALKISRSAVRAVLESGAAPPPRIVRPEKAREHHEAIVELYARCHGNLVRVHEELEKLGAKLSYQALTAFCRRHEIGRAAKLPAGRYEFAPGEEMQHDTSPHQAPIGGRVRKVQIASLVLCYSRMTFIQLYPCFSRFECKVFLTDALEYFGGAAGRCLVDNTNVVRLKGTGQEMVPVPEMVAFGERFGFVFAAHELGDANRSARVENPFNWVQNNFLAGREFADWDDVNAQARAWCEQKNAARSPKLHASRRELFAAERLRLKPLPIFIPEVYVLHQRFVDAEGYVTVRRNRYSVPYKLIGHQMEVRESKQRIDIFDGARQVATHPRVVDPVDARLTKPEHRPPRGEGRSKSEPPREELELLAAAPEFQSYVAALKQRAYGRGVKTLRCLLRLVREYPHEALMPVLRTAAQYGLYDLERVERMVLRQIARDYFVLPNPDADSDVPPEGEDEDE